MKQFWEIYVYIYIFYIYKENNINKKIISENNAINKSKSDDENIINEDKNDNKLNNSELNEKYLIKKDRKELKRKIYLKNNKIEAFKNKIKYTYNLIQILLMINLYQIFLNNEYNLFHINHQINITLKLKKLDIMKY